MTFINVFEFLKGHVFGDNPVVVGGMGRERKAMIKVVVTSLLMLGRAIANVQMEQKQ